MASDRRAVFGLHRQELVQEPAVARDALAVEVPGNGSLSMLVNPAAVGRIVRDAGALYLLDATQAVGQFPATSARRAAIW